MLQNARFTAFTLSELLGENQQGGYKITPTSIQIRVNLRQRIDETVILAFQN